MRVYSAGAWLGGVMCGGVKGPEQLSDAVGTSCYVGRTALLSPLLGGSGVTGGG